MASRKRNAAFTLVESVVAMAIIAIAASAVLLGVDSSLQTTRHCQEQTMAQGLARQLLDEVLGSRYSLYQESGGVVVDTAHDIVLKPSAWKAATGTRERFTDSDDYNGFRAQGPRDTWGARIGQEDRDGRTRHPALYVPAGLLDSWRQEISVSYVAETDLSQSLPQGATPTDYRAVEVRIVKVDPVRGDRLLATARQVIAYVPPLP